MKKLDLNQRLSQLETRIGSAKLRPPGPEATKEERCVHMLRTAAYQRGEPMGQAEAQSKAGLVLGFIQAAEQMQGQPVP